MPKATIICIVCKTHKQFLLSNQLVNPDNDTCPLIIKEIEIKPHTANGDKIILSGCGIKPNKKGLFGHTLGDLVATVVYAKPNKYSSEELKKIKELSNMENPQVEKFYKDIAKELENE